MAQKTNLRGGSGRRGPDRPIIYEENKMGHPEIGVGMGKSDLHFLSIKTGVVLSTRSFGFYWKGKEVFNLQWRKGPKVPSPSFSFDADIDSNPYQGIFGKEKKK